MKKRTEDTGEMVTIKMSRRHYDIVSGKLDWLVDSGPELFGDEWGEDVNDALDAFIEEKA